MIEKLQSLTWQDMIAGLICLVLLMQLYNLFCTTRKNAREAKKQKEQPTADIRGRIDTMERYLDNDKRRLEEHDKQIVDIRGGQKAICGGVQALLEHELHDDNNVGDMESASKEINDWLKNRP